MWNYQSKSMSGTLSDQEKHKRVAYEKESQYRVSGQSHYSRGVMAGGKFPPTIPIVVDGTFDGV